MNPPLECPTTNIRLGSTATVDLTSAMMLAMYAESSTPLWNRSQQELVAFQNMLPFGSVVPSGSAYNMPFAEAVATS